MGDVKTRVAACFKTVFPDLSETEILTASQDSVLAWDSVASLTLVNVLEEEFSIEMDLDALGELNTFDRVHEYLRAESPKPS